MLECEPPGARAEPFCGYARRPAFDRPVHEQCPRLPSPYVVIDYQPSVPRVAWTRVPSAVIPRHQHVDQEALVDVCADEIPQGMIDHGRAPIVEDGTLVGVPQRALPQQRKRRAGVTKAGSIVEVCSREHAHTLRIDAHRGHEHQHARVDWRRPVGRRHEADTSLANNLWKSERPIRTPRCEGGRVTCEAHRQEIDVEVGEQNGVILDGEAHQCPLEKARPEVDEELAILHPTQPRHPEAATRAKWRAVVKPTPHVRSHSLDEGALGAHDLHGVAMAAQRTA